MDWQLYVCSKKVRTQRAWQKGCQIERLMIGGQKEQEYFDRNTNGYFIVILYRCCMCMVVWQISKYI